MQGTLFQEVFSEEGINFLKSNILLALQEDGSDLTAQGIFPEQQNIRAHIIAKEDTFVTALLFIPYIFEVYMQDGGSSCLWQACVKEGDFVKNGTEIVRLHGPCADILKLERVILNYITHLSGISNMTKRYVDALEGTGVKLLDTRKTLPGLRWPEKYAVRVGGGFNHRRNLQEMLMLKDNHIDAAGSITKAVHMLRNTYKPCPPIEVECRHKDEVQEAVAAKPERIMLDNMNVPMLKECLPLIPKDIEAEISGGVTIENIRELALADGVMRRADFISVGRVTHSAPSADFSMRIIASKDGICGVS